MMYKRYKTTMGRTYYMRCAEDERMERMLFRIAVIVMPFVAAAGMFALWVKGF